MTTRHSLYWIYDQVGLDHYARNNPDDYLPLALCDGQHHKRSIDRALADVEEAIAYDGWWCLVMKLPASSRWHNEHASLENAGRSLLLRMKRNGWPQNEMVADDLDVDTPFNPPDPSRKHSSLPDSDIFGKLTLTYPAALS